MVKYLTRVETNVGYETYTLHLESEKSMDYNEGCYYIEDVFISKLEVRQSNTNVGPFAAKQFYQKLKFPIQNTMYSEQKFEYGDDKKTNKNG